MHYDLTNHWKMDKIYLGSNYRLTEHNRFPDIQVKETYIT